MSTSVQVVCVACAQIDCVPVVRLAQQPRCGSCQQALLDVQPAVLDDRSFVRFVSRTELPVVVDFWAAWCGPCKMMTPVFAQAAAHFATRARFVKVDSDACPETAQRHAIRSISTLLVFRDGHAVARQTGALDGGHLAAFLAPHLGNAPTRV